ncbi:MAG: 2-oxo-4-hydroxy-4-carboxy-5-ureidoimidazoline decarboxylase [Burkholderia sp.]|jgi:2-oxo-4-hydroxy-4-carboxy-5-ureidoimidazoline decarboxylase|uniref:2-oxo-4-hydroxy-4-carboxy-5-ureidoimidazoline decarboxylase n=1 Tax=Burkholderia TaxID=32008 RepID=UPI00158C10D0|nr:MULTISPECIES: 2-oxo-4-hydroxy-4-carboxy-5-ureidoimidazoline decarboxylase [Burkholderia]MCA8046545.1 2-oxo-4-hydroxy-4-carboxy-5-ureidoimidazoline decarboxylase [Burkholderia arboris]MDR0241754.1 2-oxo-4-hydroxy-4-carboxy-5-ureidoimidazoline decarboxylase [Burkholderia sp.]
MSSTSLDTTQLAAINAMAKDQFVQALGDIFEHSPDVAEDAWAARPFASVDALHDAMMGSIRARGIDAKKAFFDRHPELSAQAVRGGGLTHASVSEQTSAGLDALTDDEEIRLQRMNRAYREQHGFPFIICVRHYTKAGIFFELESRVSRETAFELDYALNQIKAITRRRLDQRVA